jgi:hypothetical protein
MKLAVIGLVTCMSSVAVRDGTVAIGDFATCAITLKKQVAC